MSQANTIAKKEGNPAKNIAKVDNEHCKSINKPIAKLDNKHCKAVINVTSLSQCAQLQTRNS